MSFFGTSIDKHSTLTDAQKAIQSNLGTLFGQMLGLQPFFTPGMQNSFMQQIMNGGMGPNQKNLWNQGLKELLSGRPTDVRPYWEQGVLKPALENFDEQIAPRIASSFAAHGASLGSRKGNALSDALTGVYSDAQGQLAGMRTSMYESAKNRQLAAMGIPMQQMGSQINALQGLTNATYGFPMAFVGQQTQQLTGSQGLGSSLLGLGGMLFGGMGGLGGLAGLFGGGGGSPNPTGQSMMNMPAPVYNPTSNSWAMYGGF